jgi:hypothetical protein
LKKISYLLLLAFILSGCTTYKFQKPDASSQGYLAYYDGTPIAEYTVGREKSLPELTLAKERFKRRKSTVESYYKRMDQIESRLKAFLWEPPVMVVSFLGGVFRWPFIAVADYKYNHNPEYRAKVDRLDEEKETLETSRVNDLRKELNAYIAKDLAEESGGPGVIETALVELKPEPPTPVLLQKEMVEAKAPAPIVQPPVQVGSKAPLQDSPQPGVIQQESALAKEPVAPAAEPVEVKPMAPVEELPPAKPALEPPVAVIMAKPLKGYSPLKVNFSGQKSSSKSGKIVAYAWDFGDGDTSTQKNPENTYWSTTFGSRNFTVTLTVRDQEGSVSSATSTIEVITR